MSKINFRLSASSINTFFQCPKKFEYNYLLKPTPVIEREVPQALWGTKIHEIIASYYEELKAHPVTEKPEIEAKIIDIFESNIDPTLGSDYAKLAAKCRDNFIKYELNRPESESLGIEIKKRNTQLTGKIDLLIDNEKVVDWKTGKPQPFFDEGLLVQGSIYLILTGAKKAEFVFLKNGKVLTLNVPDTKLVQNKVARIREAEVFRIKESGLCRFCEFYLWCQFRDKSLWQM